MDFAVPSYKAVQRPQTWLGERHMSPRSHAVAAFKSFKALFLDINIAYGSTYILSKTEIYCWLISLTSQLKNPTIYNIIRWFTDTLGQMTRQTSV